VSAHHAVAVGAAVALLGLVLGPVPTLAQGHPLLWAVAWIAVAWQLRSVLHRIGSFRWWTWMLFPLPLLAFDVLFARSAALTVVRRSVQWRGRAVALSRQGSAEEGI
jgi:4,4'-diaponeurosporenoate glycosyltransferase